MNQSGVEQRPVSIRPRTGIPEGGLSSEPVKRKGIVGKLGQFARRVLASVNTEKPSDKAF
mgnify:CR=1 FL=1